MNLETAIRENTAALQALTNALLDSGTLASTPRVQAAAVDPEVLALYRQGLENPRPAAALTCKSVSWRSMPTPAK